jgi:hypothetical protein
MARKIKKYALVIYRDSTTGAFVGAKMITAKDGVWYYYKDVAPYIKESRPTVRKAVQRRKGKTVRSCMQCRNCSGWALDRKTCRNYRCLYKRTASPVA